MRALILALCCVPLTAGAQTWCTPFVSTAYQNGPGITNVSIGTITNATSAQTAAGAYYNDYSSKFTAKKQGQSQAFSITVGAIATKFTVFVDWNNDGDFADAGESLATASGTSVVLSGSFTVPATAKTGAKRMRLSADASANTPGSCANLLGEFEDYTFVVLDSSQNSPNIGAEIITSPAQKFSLSSNTVTFKTVNLDPDTGISSFTIGYSINGTTIATQSISGGSVNLGPAKDTTISFSTGYTPAGMGTCTLRVWAEKPNGGGTGRKYDDTIQKVVAMCNALAGTYTIDPNGSGSTNFKSFADAWFYLSSCGVTGPVVINVAPGTYNERISLSNISGLSASNTVTFKGTGSNPSNVVITMSAFDSYRNFILQLERTNWWRFNNMTIRNAYSAGVSRGIYVQNSSNNIFTGLQVEAYNKTSAVNTNAPFYATGTKIDSNSLVNCILSGGSFPVCVLGLSTSKSNKFTITGCQLSSAPDGGMNIQYVKNVTADSNYIDMAYSTLNTVFGLRLDYCDSATVVTRNVVRNITSGGIALRLYYCEGGRITKGQVTNNMFSVTGTAANCYGIYSYYSTYYNFYHNSIYLNTSTASSYCFGLFGSGTYRTNIYNNLFTNRGTGRVMIIQSSALVDKESYNGLYTTGTVLCVDGATTKATLALWQAVASTKYGINDFTGVNPSYKSATDLHLSSGCSMSKAPRLSAVPRDLDYQLRDTPTFVGADEVNIKNFDASPTAIISPSNPVTIGSNNIVFTLSNRGWDSLTSVTVAYNMNGGALTTTTISLSPALLSCGTRNLTISSVPFGVGRNYFKIYITKLNSTINDQNPSDDTLGYEFCARYSGTYYIDKNKAASATNFTSFTDAVSKLTNCGINGSVTVRVVEGSGPYNERVLITAAIPGASRTNTVTFKGNYLSDTLYSGITTSADPGLIKISAASHIIFDSLMVINTSSSGGYGFHLTGNSDSCIIKNCLVRVSPTSSVNFAAVVLSGSVAATSSNHGDYTRIQKNDLYGGFAGIYANGLSSGSMNTDLVITDNTITGFYTNGIYLKNQLRPVITGNTITTNSSGTSTGSTVVFNTTDIFTFQKNNLTRCGLYAIELTSANVTNGNTSNRAEISNNFIGGNWLNSSAIAIYYNTAAYINVYFNSVSMPTGTALSNTGTNSGHRVKNNIFSVHNSSAVVLNWTNSTALDAGGMDYNLYWNNNNASVITVFGATLSSGTLSSSGHNGNSKYGNPDFVNAASELHTFGSNPNNAGVSITGITNDIDNDIRPFTGGNVDIGADEYSPLGLDITPLRLDGPTAPFIKGSNNVTCEFKNLGSSSLDSFDASWYVNDTLQGSIRWYGLLNNSNTTIQALGNYNFGHGRYKITVITSAPNGGSDDRPRNDTLISWICAALSGTYTINSGAAASSTNYSSMKQAFLDCYECGITANVTFNTTTGSGPYPGPVEIGMIPGASATASVTVNANGTTFTAATNKINNAVIRLNGTSYLNINDLKIQSVSVYYAWGLHMMNGCTKNKLNGCSILLPNVYATNGQNTCGLVYSASRTHPFTAGNNAYNNSFTNGFITSGTGGAATAVSLCGGINADTASANIFHYNTISNYIYNGIYAKFGGRDSISYNIIESPAALLNRDKCGISLDSGASGMQLNGNIIRKPFSDTSVIYTFNGLKINQVNPAAGKTLQVYNNQIYYIRSQGKIRGIWLQNSSRSNIWHNSIAIEDNLSSSSLQTTGIELAGTGDLLSNTQLKNNLISVKRGGTGSKSAIVIGNTSSNGSNVNYNNLYTTGSNAVTGIYNSIDYAGITNWKSIGLFDQNSNDINPQFPDLGSGELYPANPILDKAGTWLNIKKDAFGNPRHPSKPDVGAVEFGFELRTDTADYTATGSPDVREGHWYQALDDSGKLVFAVNPNTSGSLGNMNWKVRILKGVSKVRGMGLYSSPGTDSGWFLNRNFLIEPGVSPTAQVSLRLYITRPEVSDLRTALTNLGKSTGTFNQFINDSLQVTKYIGPSPDLEPRNGTYAAGNYSVFNPTCDSFSNLNFYALRFNTASFSEFNPSFIPKQIIPLPVHFINLQAVWVSAGAKISWTASNDMELAEFEVDRSDNGLTFTSIGRVSAALGTVTYSYTDFDVQQDKDPLLYYRIRLIAPGNRPAVSPVVKLTAVTRSSISVFPNPCSENIQLNLPAQLKGNLDISLINTQGKLLFKNYLQMTGNQTSQIIQLPDNLSAGVYFLRLGTSAGTEVIELVIH